MTRGMTLLEVVIAISLLSALMLASLDWTRTSAVLTARASNSLEWDTAARATLRLIDEDLALGDFDPVGSSQGVNQRVHVHNGRLSIQTRERAAGGGGVNHEYAFHEAKSLLELRGRPLQRSPGRVPYQRVILGEVRRFEVEVDEEEACLIAEIESTSGRRYRRRYALP